MPKGVGYKGQSGASTGAKSLPNTYGNTEVDGVNAHEEKKKKHIPGVGSPAGKGTWRPYKS